jgi:tRNA(Met) C34 N-acetyltransferase TmcA
MTNGFKCSSKLINLILRKNNIGADGKCGQCPDNGFDYEAARACFGLNRSQAHAVNSCISACRCPHRSFTQLIWGPPGTGKTKTVSVILHGLLILMPRARILVCAPTNTAMLQLASHLVPLVEKFCKSKNLINAIILFGNMECMRQKADNEKLSKLFESNCVSSEASRTKYARLVFCTPYRSTWLENQKFDILVIDEAANLK